MLAEWNAACADDDPTLVVPWSDPATGAHFIDLRAEPYDVAEIPEAEHTPALARALRALNATRSPIITAKCDVWTIPSAGDTTHDTDDLSALQLELEADPASTPAAFAGYIDFLWRERALFISAHRQQDRLDQLIRRATRLDHPQAKLECTLRPALLDRTSALEGYAVTLYLFALGHDAASAALEWDHALESVVDLLRSREFEPARGSATIDLA